MIKPIALLAIFSFILLAVFGFVAMNHQAESGHGCLASSGYGNLCLMNNAFAIAFFHINFLKSFSQAVIPFLAAAFLVVLILGATSQNLVLSRVFSEEKKPVFSFRKPFSPPRYRFLDWFAVLRENISA